MPLPWIRLDTSMPDNPKVLLLLDAREGHRAAFVWCCSLAYAGKHGTDGFIPRFALSRINGRPADASRLIEHGLWDAVDGGWHIHGWGEMQESTDETKKRSERARVAAHKRWEKKGPTGLVG
jgi:hypothetical protein